MCTFAIRNLHIWQYLFVQDIKIGMCVSVNSAIQLVLKQ